MFRRSFLGLALFVSALAGVSPALAGGPRPFHSEVTAQWDNVLAALPPSSRGAGVAHFVGGGPTTHMGNTTQVGSLSLFPVSPDPAALIPGGGEVTITAANGDTLSFSFFGTLNPLTFEGTGDFIFTGGTGRFAGATGHGTFDALIDVSHGPVGAPMTVALDGHVTY